MSECCLQLQAKHPDLQPSAWQRDYCAMQPSGVVFGKATHLALLGSSSLLLALACKPRARQRRCRTFRDGSGQLQGGKLTAPLNRSHAKFYSSTIRIKWGLDTPRPQKSIEFSSDACPVVLALHICAHKLQHLLRGSQRAGQQQRARSNKRLLR